MPKTELIDGTGDSKPQSLIEALRRAQMKLRAYIGVCKDDKELPKVIEIVSDALNMLTCDCPAHVRERSGFKTVVEGKTRQGVQSDDK